MCLLKGVECFSFPYLKQQVDTLWVSLILNEALLQQLLTFTPNTQKPFIVSPANSFHQNSALP